MKILGILHDLKKISLGKGPFTQPWGRLEKHVLLLYDYHLLLENEWNALCIYVSEFYNILLALFKCVLNRIYK